MGQASASEQRIPQRPTDSSKTSDNNQTGLYIPVQIFGVKANALLDTGSTISVISPRLFDKIPSHLKPEISPSNRNLCMANGDTSTPQGRVMLQLAIKGTSLWHSIIIADIEAPIILGYDFMYEHNCALDVRKGNLKIGKYNVKCQPESHNSSIFRIRLDTDFTVPPGSEMIVSGSVEDNHHCLSHVTEAIVESKSDSVLAKQGILVAKALVNPSIGRVPLRLMNLTGQPQALHTHTIAATVECVENVTALETDPRPTDSCPVRSVHDLDLKDLPDHLRVVWDANSSDLTDQQRQSFLALLLKHQTVFAQSKYDLGRTDLVQHKIDTGDHKPIKQAPRRLPLNKREIAEKEVKAMLANNIIEPSTSAWSSPVVLVEKKDHSTRFCVDYRALNDITSKDSYPLPRIDDCFDALGGTTWFSSIDLQSGYWQVAMDPDSIDKTAFSCQSGLFQFRVLPFGVCNGPPTFQRLMEHVLSGLQWKICLLYLDDIIVFSKTFEEHLEKLSQVLSRIGKAGLKISPKKCHFFQHQVHFLGHVVSKDGVGTDWSKTQAVRDWPIPTSVKQVRSFLGLCSYYRRYVHNFAQIARPLHKLTEKDTFFNWTEECQASFDQLKHLLTTSPVLAYPIPGLPYILDTDSSLSAHGSVLSQVQDGHERVISFYSRCLTKAERNYCITRKELLAIVASVKHFHHYLYGSKCTVRTDHGALTWLLKFKNPEGQLARWLEVLSTYDLTITFRAGKTHNNADAMSRIPCNSCSYCSKKEADDTSRAQTKAVSSEPVRKMILRSDTHSDDNVEPNSQSQNWLEAKSPEALRVGQMNDPEIKLVIQWLESSQTRPAWDDISHLGLISKHYWSQWERLKLISGVLYREWFETKGDSKTLQLVLPQEWREEVLNMLHDNICTGHMGITRTIARVRSRFYWVGFKQDVVNKCNSCQVCQARKMPTTPLKAPLKPYIVGMPMERVQIDIVTPLPESYSGNKHILSLTDCFTKWIECFPLRAITAKAVASTLVNQFISRFGIPREIHTDQGSQFESELFREMCSLLGIDKTRTTAFHPAGDGLIERAHRTLEDMLSKYVEKNQRNWDEALPLILMAYRSSKQESTTMTPSLMMLGREIELPVDLLYPPPPTDTKLPSNEYVVQLQNKMKIIHETARASLLEASQKQKRLYDSRISKQKYNVGDAVWLRMYIKPKGLSKKLQLRWDGPFKIVSKLSDLTFKIQKGPRALCKIVHFNRLKRYTGRLGAWFRSRSQ